MNSSVSTKMMIPKTLSIGYQKRADTYTGKLAYVIYTDDKGVLRKAKSWESWRDKKIDPDHYDNTPRSGFVLNKKVGGYKSDWNMRQTYVRVFDPHGFEFEISVPNLLFILQETSSIQGKGLEGEFVYAWHGTDLVLLPTCSNEYQECAKFTQAQAGKVKKDQMEEGHTYLMKDMTEVMYLGKHDYFEKISWSKKYKPVGPRHIFLKLKLALEPEEGETEKESTEAEKYVFKEEPYKEEPYKEEPYLVYTGFDKVAAKTSTEVSPLYADAFSKFKRSRYSDKVVDVKLHKVNITDKTADQFFILKEKEDKYVLVALQYYHQYSSYNSYGTRREVNRTFVRCGEIDLSANNKGSIALPKRPAYSRYANSTNEESVGGHDLYSAALVTAKGHTLDLSDNL